MLKNTQLLYVTPLKVLILKQSNLEQIFCCFLSEAGLGKENKQTFFSVLYTQDNIFSQRTSYDSKNQNTTTEVRVAFRYNNFFPPKRTRSFYKKIDFLRTTWKKNQ